MRVHVHRHKSMCPWAVLGSIQTGFSSMSSTRLDSICLPSVGSCRVAFTHPNPRPRHLSSAPNANPLKEQTKPKRLEVFQAQGPRPRGVELAVSLEGENACQSSELHSAALLRLAVLLQRGGGRLLRLPLRLPLRLSRRLLNTYCDRYYHHDHYDDDYYCCHCHYQYTATASTIMRAKSSTCGGGRCSM